jgi:hypothetical protein
VPRCGFNRNTKKAILYGPLALGGASFQSLYVQQGVSQVMMFIRQWRTNSIPLKTTPYRSLVVSSSSGHILLFPGARTYISTTLGIKMAPIAPDIFAKYRCEPAS